MTDRGFTHPNFGREARVEVIGREVRLTFVAGTHAQANSLAETIVGQMQAGALNITLMGKPTSVPLVKGSRHARNTIHPSEAGLRLLHA